MLAVATITSVVAWKLQVFGPDINGFVVIFGVFQFMLTVITAFVATTDVFIPIIGQNMAEYRGKKWPKYDFHRLFQEAKEVEYAEK